MTSIFNINRFLLSFRRLLVERGVKLFGSIFALIIITFLFMNIKMDPNIYFGVQNAFATLGLMFGPILFSHILASEFDSQPKGISYLLLPNSSFEKWLLNAVLGIGLYFVIYLVLFRLIDLWMIERITTSLALPAGAINVLPFDSNQSVISILTGAILANIVLTGTLYFKKNSLIFSMLAAFLFFALLFIVNYFIANAFFADSVAFWNQVPFGTVLIESETSNSGLYVLQPDVALKTRAYSVLLPFVLIFSGLHFARIREKQL